MKILAKPILLTLMMLACFGAAAQGYTTLQGRVTDSQTRRAVPYVAVLLEGTSVGTQSSDAGEWKLKVDKSRLQADATVAFSALGYKKQIVSVEQLKKSGTVRLEPFALQLTEVAVTDFRTPQALIAEAVSRLPQNYRTDTTIGTWFCRDWRMLDGELYLFDESVVDMLRYGYTHNASKRYYSQSSYRREMDDNYKAVRKHRLLVYDSVAVRMAASGSAADEHLQYSDNNSFYDILSTPNANYLTAPRLVKRHRFEPIQEYTDDDGQSYYLLNATSKDGRVHYRWLIHKADLAIVEMEGISDSSTHHYKPSTWSVQPYASRHQHGGRYSYRYAKRGGAYTMTAFSAYSDYTCRSHRMYGHEHDAEEQRFTTSREWYLTDLRPGDSLFLTENTVQGHKPVDMATAFGSSTLDEDFWERYNTLALDTALQASLARAMERGNRSSGNSVDDESLTSLDSLSALRKATPMTMPPMPRWTFYRYGGIGGNRLVGEDEKTKRGFSQQLALGTKLHLGGRLNLHADLQYAWMTTKTDDGSRLNTHSLTLPLRVAVDLMKETPDRPARLYLTAGAWGRSHLLGRQGGDWQVVGRDLNRWDYGWSWGIGIEASRAFFIEWNSYRSLNDTFLDMHRHNGAFAIGINF